MHVFQGLVVLLIRKKWRIIHADYVIRNNAGKILMAKIRLVKRPMEDPWKDFYSILFAKIVSSLNPAQILGPAKVFCKKFESS